MTSKYSLLIELKRGWYHLLPPEETSQDLNMKGFKSGSAIQTKHVYQKDGSRLKVIYTKTQQPSDIIARIHHLMPSQHTILKQKPYRLEAVIRKENVDYLAYMTNTFFNSVRVLPVIVDHKNMCFYNMQQEFPKLIPEDDIGVLIPSSENLHELYLENLGEPTLIPYLSNKRMCAHCGIVSDHTKKLKNPWNVARKV